jgi:uroporphyrinogen decarboxylase
MTRPSIEDLHLPDIDMFFTESWREEVSRFISSHQEQFLVVNYGFGLFERSWTLRGFEEALMDAYAEPEFYDALIDRITDHHMRIVERLLELPIDGIMFSDDWGYQRGVLIDPPHWRRYFKTRYQKLYALTHEAGKRTLSHCCGDVAALLPDLIEMKLDVLESVQPEAMDPYELKRQYGDKITFWGGLGSQSTIQFGTPDEIRKETDRLCAEMGRGGGYILGPAKAIQPGTPVENTAAVVEAFLNQSGVSVR